MEEAFRSEAGVAPAGGVGGRPGRKTASEVFGEFLQEGLHVDLGRLALWVRAHPGCRDPLLRLAYGLRHVPPSGSANGLTAAEAGEVRRGILAEVAAHDREVGDPADTTRMHAALDPLPARVVVGAFLVRCADGRTGTALRWCRCFPDAAYEIIEAASALTLGALGRPPGAGAPGVEADPPRRGRLVARAQALLDAEARGAARAGGAGRRAG